MPVLEDETFERGVENLMASVARATDADGHFLGVDASGVARAVFEALKSATGQPFEEPRSLR